MCLQIFFVICALRMPDAFLLVNVVYLNMQHSVNCQVLILVHES